MAKIFFQRRLSAAVPFALCGQSLVSGAEDQRGYRHYAAIFPDMENVKEKLGPDPIGGHPGAAEESATVNEQLVSPSASAGSSTGKPSLRNDLAKDSPAV